MSEETKTVQDGADPTKGQGLEGVDKNEMPANNELAYDTYKRALDQRKRFKEENDDLRARLERIEQEKLEQEGKVKEKADYWKEKAVDLEKKFSESSAKYAWTQVKSQLANQLAKEGCVDPDVAINLIDKKELKSVEVNDQYEVNPEDLSRIVDSLKKDDRLQKIQLFNAKVDFKDMTPGKGVVTNKEPSQMSKDELLKELGL